MREYLLALLWPALEPRVRALVAAMLRDWEARPKAAEPPTEPKPRYFASSRRDGGKP